MITETSTPGAHIPGSCVERGLPRVDTTSACSPYFATKIFRFSFLVSRCRDHDGIRVDAHDLRREQGRWAIYAGNVAVKYGGEKLIELPLV